MYFLDESIQRKVLNCPSCSAIFIKGKGANCLDNCSDKWLENKHRRIFEEIIKSYLPGRDIKFEYSMEEPIVEGKGVEWGWPLICIL